MCENIDLLKNKLNELIAKEGQLFEGEVLKISRELDKEIITFYLADLKI